MFVKNNDVEYNILDEKSKRKILAHEGNLMMVEVSFEKGGVGSVHKHMHEQISYLAKGMVEFELDGDKYVMEAGDSVYIPSNSEHGLYAMEPSVIVDIFNPQREDFLK
ncbi:MAG: cupin domain-containing protein [Clostridia bacterium]|nr:cupin domain-containing protein [Clostridia bacterium]MCI8980632.1 cupin domain-containing protein [Clostridia bacterium]MCI9086636.1 cupin domain-containing protein [Clostridia bacterium]